MTQLQSTPQKDITLCTSVTFSHDLFNGKPLFVADVGAERLHDFSYEVESRFRKLCAQKHICGVNKGQPSAKCDADLFEGSPEELLAADVDVILSKAEREVLRLNDDPTSKLYRRVS